MSNKIAVDISFGEIDNNLQSADLQVFLDSSNNINLRGRKKQELYTIGIDLLCFKIENQVGNVILSNNLNIFSTSISSRRSRPPFPLSSCRPLVG